MDRESDDKMMRWAASPMGDALIAVTVKDDTIDCVHYGSAVLVDAGGSVIWSVGNPDRLVFERSTTKPFRALTILRAGVADAFGLDDADIALIAGSHSGTKMHVARARGILAKCGLDMKWLRCGIRLPLGDDGITQLAECYTPLSPLHCDCSGEHAGTLAFCRHRGYDLCGYLDSEHPVQRDFAQTIQEFSDTRETVGPTVQDRCGMPTTAVTLTTLASRLVRLLDSASSDESVARILAAIADNPFMYTGAGRLIGDLIRFSKGNIIGKDGAEGVYTIGWLNAKIALAIKVADGNHRAAIPVLDRAAKVAGVKIPPLHEFGIRDGFSEVSAATLDMDEGQL